jgi:hypothetical protein
MKTLTVLCNVVLFGFTCLVLATDGAPTAAVYIIFTLLLMLIPVFTVFAITRSGAGDGGPNLHSRRKTAEAQPRTGVFSSAHTAIARVAAICNVVLLVFVCWAFVDQYPHPEEDGFIAFAALTVLTPILSGVMLFRSRPGNSRCGPRMKLDAAAPD